MIKIKKKLIYIAIIYFLLHISANIYNTNKLKSQLIFSEKDICRISAYNTTSSSPYNYEFSSAIIKEINNQFLNSEKEVIGSLSSEIPKDKAYVDILLDGIIEKNDGNNGTYKTAIREISILPNNDKSVYASLTIRSETNEEFESKVFLVESSWLSQYLIHIANELNTKSPK